MTNLIDDIVSLTNVSEKTLEKFLPIARYCVCHSVYEALCEKTGIAEIDFGYGHLQIKIDSCGLCYKFIPSKDLEQMLIDTIKTKNSPLIRKLENNLQDKIDETYRELV